MLPESFIGPVGEADFYFAVDVAPVAAHAIAGRRSGWLGLVGRLKPGVSEAAAASEIASIWAQLKREYPEEITQALDVVPMRDALVGDTRTPLVVLLASAGLVLLVACANLAGVQLSRALSRRREFAVRVALGAGRSRIVRQVLSENMLLGLAGGIAGLLLAALALTALQGLASSSLPSYAELSLDGGAILAAAFIALGGGLRIRRGAGARDRGNRPAGDAARRDARCQRDSPLAYAARGARCMPARALHQLAGGRRLTRSQLVGDDQCAARLCD